MINNNVITVQTEEDRALIASRAQELYRITIDQYEDEQSRLFHLATLLSRKEWECERMKGGNNEGTM